MFDVISFAYNYGRDTLQLLDVQRGFRYRGQPFPEGVLPEALERFRNVRESLRKVKESSLAPWQKLTCVRTFVLQRIHFLLGLGEPPNHELDLLDGDVRATVRFKHFCVRQLRGLRGWLSGWWAGTDAPG